MEKTIDELYPIMGIENEFIISKGGDYTAAFRLFLPEIFSLSDQEYECLHEGWVKAIKILPPNCILHRQDWFTRKEYQQKAVEGENFLRNGAARHFNGRTYLAQECLVFLTKIPGGKKPGNSIFSNLLRPTLVSEELVRGPEVQAFTDLAARFARVLEDTRLVKLERLEDTDILSDRRHSGVLERYFTLSGEPGKSVLADITFGDEVQIGPNRAAIFTLGDAALLPGVCGPRINYDIFSTDKTKFPVGFAAGLGLLLRCDHVYNQYIFTQDPQVRLKELERKRLRLQSLSGYSRENAAGCAAVNEFLNEAVIEQRLPVKAHFNVMVWAEDAQGLRESKRQVASAMAGMDAAVKQETAGAPQIWWAGIPGNAGAFPVNDTFDTFAEQACCFLNAEDNYHSAARGSGIRFCDRVSGRPVYVDLYDGPRAKGLTANMGTLVCGTSGGGKSMTVNHILNTLHEQGAHCVTVDIGGSYKGLCELLGGYYFTYEEERPIRFNPFYLAEGERLDTEKKESLKALLISLWKQEKDSYNRAEYVALSNALQGYYQLLEQDGSIFPCFDSFYEYLETAYKELLDRQRVSAVNFDIDNFLYVLKPYYKGGEFDYLLNARENLDMTCQSFIVFELDQIKDHPILFPVVTLIIMELFISKMRRLKGIRKVLTIDEAWKAIAKSGMAEFLRYAFKTIRKFNGVPIVVTQELDDLVSSPIIKDAIINNADVKILMDMRGFQGKIEKLQEALGLSEKGKAILLSVNKDHREVFISLGGQDMKVYRNELSPEEYFAYTTEGSERVRVVEYRDTYGSLEQGIAAIINEEKHNKKL